jgi:predicted KAP-like P-loop ATPase
MKIKHQEIEIPAENPFSNCKLSREAYAKVLSDIVRNYADGFVLAINNEWGTGKTTFVKMWKQHLNNEGFQTVYFNAWENDFDSNPLVALMSELKPLTKGKIDGEKVFKTVVEKGAVLVKNVVPVLAKSLFKKYVADIDDIGDAFENTTKAATEILEEEIEEYAVKKKTVSEFRKELKKFIEKTGTDQPLIFIIDELDRCRPNYSVEVLEQMKHFFSVPGSYLCYRLTKII